MLMKSLPDVTPTSAGSRIRWRTAALGSTVGALCLALCWSALQTYRTLTKLQTDFLRNQAAGIAAAVEFAGRGQTKTSLAEFQHRVEEITAGYGNLEELAVISSERRVLAHSSSGKLGQSFEAPGLADLLYSRKIYEEKFEVSKGEPIYKFMFPVHLEVIKDAAMQPAESDSMTSIVVIGLYVSSANFITRQGRWNLIFTVSVCSLLVAITAYYFIAVRRSLRLEAVQAKERQWALLGRMSAALAHDIRNPLSAIKGLAQVLGEKTVAEDKAPAYIQTIVREAERLEKLVGDLLVFARPKRPQPQPFLLKQLVDDSAMLFERAFLSAGVQLRTADENNSLSLTTDYELLKRVLINLIENSLQAMPEGGNIFISGRRDLSLKRVILQIEDEGQGLTLDGQRAFEPFCTSRDSGTGLGLAISRQIVESLGGSICLENRAGRGATCTILLPVNP
jgi:signal transduction histidine kinase